MSLPAKVTVLESAALPDLPEEIGRPYHLRDRGILRYPDCDILCSCIKEGEAMVRIDIYLG